MFVSKLKVLGFLGIASAFGYTKFDRKEHNSLLSSTGKVILHFHADWCPTCIKQEKLLTLLQKEKEFQKVRFLKVDYDQEKELNAQYKVASQSTLVALLNGVEVGKLTGKVSQEDIQAFLESSFNEEKLKDLLKEKSSESARKMSPEKKLIFEQATEELRKSNLIEKIPKVGQKALDFTLKNVHGNKVKLTELLKRGPVILTFYRGGWCPYCNLQLRAYQKKLASFKQLGAQLVAISPEKADEGASTKAKDSLNFEVLSDPNNTVAKSYGLVFGLPPKLKELYKSFGINLETNQGNPDWELPIPATFVIGKDLSIHFQFADVDYKKRAEPIDIIEAIKTRELKTRLSAEQYRVTQEGATEKPFQNAFWNKKDPGIYVDIVSGEALFSSLDKFDSGSGWPSFTKAIEKMDIDEKEDSTLGMKRTEVLSRSGSHLGHVFNDGPKDKGGQRYCINSAALRFISVNDLASEGYPEYLKLFKK